MYVRKTVLVLILTISAVFRLYSEQLVIGGDQGWGKIFSMETRLADGPNGMATMQLADNEYIPDQSTELLIQFNNGIYDSAGTYTVKNNRGVEISGSVAEKGAGAAVFSGNQNFLELIPAETASFAAGSGRLNDFTIEFWLNPARLSEGEAVLHWSGAVETGSNTTRQDLLCGISGRNLFWEFTNFFLPPDMSQTSFILKSSRSLIPKRWHHHLIRYDSSTGLLEYLIDGIPEDSVYTNSSGEESSEIYYPFIGSAKAAVILVGRGYTGYLDELRISNSFESPLLNKYSMESGTAASEVLDLEYSDTRFTQLSAEYSTAGRTQIYYYYRISNKYFSPAAAYPKWNQIAPGEMLPPETKGRYLQIMTELFPDGTGVNTPVLKSIKLDYIKNLPPMPPNYLTGKAGNGKAVLSWQPVTDQDIAGYRIYYGDKPGYYFGVDSIAGSSPVDAGNVVTFVIDGLKNGKLYYFAVTSYDNAEIPHESTFSREISIRPSAILKED